MYNADWDYLKTVSFWDGVRMSVELLTHETRLEEGWEALFPQQLEVIGEFFVEPDNELLPPDAFGVQHRTAKSFVDIRNANRDILEESYRRHNLPETADVFERPEMPQTLGSSLDNAYRKYGCTVRECFGMFLEKPKNQRNLRTLPLPSSAAKVALQKTK